MRHRLCLLIVACFAFAGTASAQGFAGLGAEIDGFSIPSKKSRFSFPKDHGSHPQFRIEWWYLTANLMDSKGTQYGIQWTLFRNALSPEGRAEDQAWMGHAAISSPEGHFFAERLARGAFGHAGVTASPFSAFIDEWRMTGPSLSEIAVSAQGKEFAFDLNLESENPFLPHGMEGYSTKSESGQASHYYSQPFYDVAGILKLPSGEVSVTGKGWLDREWSSRPLEEDQEGWDWFSIHFEDGTKLMGFQLRSKTGGRYSVGTAIALDGAPKPLVPGSVEMVPVDFANIADRRIPVVWDVLVPELEVDIRLEAIYPDSWMATSVPYWEGPVSVSGTRNGVGYLEMTGYE